ncbi:DoxX family protein [Gordonia shandongensis]|uniref:DoxX family protein n=1 Tax=Gordonia shandongensis TaxID=376351 RepID=UPI00047B2E6B|nr:membrane protein [Gordonia shandongensis]
MSNDRLARVLSLILLVPGVLHFVAPKPFDSIVPDELPGEPRAWTHASGAAEIALGAAVLAPRTRRRAAGLAAALFVAVFPANVNMIRLWVNQSAAMKWLAWGRLPLQIPLIGLALAVRRGAPISPGASRSGSATPGTGAPSSVCRRGRRRPPR